MRGRLGPVNGYDTGTKRHYRRTIWRIFREGFGGQVADKHVMLMPSKEGDEVETALANGFREQNLHVVDWNPAIVAHLKRRFPRINTYGVEVERAASRMLDSNILLSAANLDLTWSLGQRTVRTLSRFMEDVPLNENGLVAVTLLRGREHCIEEIRQAGIGPDLEKMIPPEATRDLSVEDVGRLNLLTMILCAWFEREGDAKPVAWWFPVTQRTGVYQSPNGVHTLLWSVFRMEQEILQPGVHRAMELDLKRGRFYATNRRRAIFDSRAAATAWVRANTEKAGIRVQNDITTTPGRIERGLWMRT